jgi:hypothetical protein
MIRKLLKFFKFFIFSFAISPLFSQVSLVSAGGNGIGTSGTVSYSIGQVAYNTISAGGGNINEGVQQPYEIFTITGLQLTGIDLQFSALPNPTTDFIQLRVNGDYLSKLICRLYDFNGHLLIVKPIIENETTFSISNYPSGTYILKIGELGGTSSQNELKSFKIIKK